MRTFFASAMLALALDAPAADPIPLNERLRALDSIDAATEKTVLAWLAEDAKAFPAEPGSGALAPLAERLAAFRVVGIGEATHGTHEDLAFKSALIRAMVERGDVDVLVFELNRRTGERLDRFIAQGSEERDAAAAMKDANVYAVWMTHELADLLAWLRDWNAKSQAPVRVLGVDVQAAPRDFVFALDRLAATDADRARELRRRLATWTSETALEKHQTEIVATIDRTQFDDALVAAKALEAALKDRDPSGWYAASGARLGLEMMEYEVPGRVKHFLETPEEAWARRDIAMADRLVDSLAANERAIVWAHDSHVARSDLPYGFGATSMGGQLHHRLGRANYAVVTFSAREFEFNAKPVGDTTRFDRTTPFAVFRYVSTENDFGTFLARVGKPRFWFAFDDLPRGEAALWFRGMSYGVPGFGWGISDDTAYPFLPRPVGYSSDVIVHFDKMTPSRRLD